MFCTLIIAVLSLCGKCNISISNSHCGPVCRYLNLWIGSVYRDFSTQLGGPSRFAEEKFYEKLGGYKSPKPEEHIFWASTCTYQLTSPKEVKMNRMTLYSLMQPHLIYPLEAILQVRGGSYPPLTVTTTMSG